jgi:hypothetical protein
MPFCKVFAASLKRSEAPVGHPQYEKEAHACVIINESKTKSSGNEPPSLWTENAALIFIILHQVGTLKSEEKEEREKMNAPLFCPSRAIKRIIIK